MPPPAPLVRRPFAGLAGETEWVAMREILPAATAGVRFVAGAPEGAPAEATMATVLPLTWPAIHRQGGDVLVATQAGATCGDASRDIAAAWLQAAAAPEGVPIQQFPTPTADTPRLQDLLGPDQPILATLHDGFGFWVGEAELDEEAAASLQRADEAIVPTVRLGAESVFWVRFGERCFVRWVLPQDEDRATDGLARLAVADRSRLTPDSRLLGAFRACGLLVPVWEVDGTAEPESFEPAVAALAGPLAESIAASAPLTIDERRARNGLLSRQVTLR
jgi:hypothetical protein